MPIRYDMLAVDLDGTLLGPDRRVSAANIAAIDAARRAGMIVTVCTGRGLRECREVLEAISHDDPAVVAGGSILSCPQSGRTLHRFTLEPELVGTATDVLLHHGHPALILKDPAETGYDYLVVRGPGEHPLDPVTKWWFSSMGVGVRDALHLHEDEHPQHSVRLGACARASVLEDVSEALSRHLGPRATMHHFPAVVAPDEAATTAAGDRLHILEVFSPMASKWSAIRWLASQRGIEPGRIAAIGDEINDLPMIRGAGLGIAMGNAIPAVRDAAGRQTRGHDADGVAFAIEQLLAGRW